MLKSIGALNTCLAETIEDVTKIVKPLTHSAVLMAECLELHAQELKEETEYEIMLKTLERKKNKVSKVK